MVGKHCRKHRVIVQRRLAGGKKAQFHPASRVLDREGKEFMKITPRAAVSA
jgi:hypothetical protein